MLNHTDRCWPRSCDTEPLGINTKVIQHLRRIKGRAGSRTDRHAEKPAGRPPKLISSASGRVQDHKTKNVVPPLLFRGLGPGFCFLFFAVASAFKWTKPFPLHIWQEVTPLVWWQRETGVPEGVGGWLKKGTNAVLHLCTHVREWARKSNSLENSGRAEGFLQFCVGECVGRAAPAHSNYFPFTLQEVVF